MRCLYCGNELPVFKKLTGGGEFCSEAHRQSYQEEYNRLALSRLLQAQTPDDRAKAAKRGGTDTLAPVAPVVSSIEVPATRVNSSTRPNRDGSAKPELIANGKHAAQADFENAPPFAIAVTSAPTNSINSDDEAVSPADPADFLWEVPDPIWWESVDLRPSAAVFCEATPQPVQPAGVGLMQLDAIEEEVGDLVMAAPMSMAGLRQASSPQDYKARTRENRLEVREFGRVEPRVTVEIATAETARLMSAVASRDFEIVAIAPPDIKEAHPWLASERPFPEGSAEIEFNDSLRLEFQTTGVEVPSEDGGETQIVQVPAPEVLTRLDAVNKVSAPPQESDLRSFLSAVPMAAESPIAAPIGEEPETAVVEEIPVESHAEVHENAIAEETALPEVAVEEVAVAEVAVAEVAEAEVAVEEVVVEEVVVEEPVEKAAVEEAIENVQAAAAVLVEPTAAPDLTQLEVAAEPEVDVAQEVEADPRRATTPMPVQPQAFAPALTAVEPPVKWLPVTSFRMHLPRVAAVPMRPVMILGPSPASQPASAVEDPTEALSNPDAALPEEPKAEASAAQSAAERRTRDPRNVTRSLKIRNRGTQASPPALRPETPPPTRAIPPVELPPAPVAAVEKTTVIEAREGARREPSKQPPVKTAVPPPVRPAVAPKQEAKQQESKQELTPEPKPSFEKAPNVSMGPSFGDMHLGGRPVGFIEGLPGAVKFGAIAAVLAVLGFVGYSSLSSGTGKGGGKELVVEAAGPGMLIGEGGWSTDWTGEAAGVRRSRQISIYRPSLNLADYRVELQGQIEAKSMGVVYRANNPQNYYVLKLEILKPGLNPQVALVRWAVINGEDGPRAQIPLPMPVRIDTLYKLRLDVRGNTFTTYVLDQKVDQWSDDRIHSGGVGLINERGDRSTIKAVMVTPLAARTK